MSWQSQEVLLFIFNMYVLQLYLYENNFNRSFYMMCTDLIIIFRMIERLFLDT